MADIDALVRKYRFLQKNGKTLFYVFLAACVIFGAVTKDTSDHSKNGKS